jgi:hypothetical protein
MIPLVTVSVVCAAANKLGADPFALLAALGSALAESVEGDPEHVAQLHEHTEWHGATVVAL